MSGIEFMLSTPERRAAEIDRIRRQTAIAKATVTVTRMTATSMDRTSK